jgi:hypothetical protein
MLHDHMTFQNKEIDKYKPLVEIAIEWINQLIKHIFSNITIIKNELKHWQ